MKFACVRVDAPPPWLADHTVRVPVHPGFDDAEIGLFEVNLEYILAEGDRLPEKPLTALLPFHYHRLPPRLRLALARRILSRREGNSFPREPIETSVDAIRWALGERPRWPAGHRYVVLLTHDVDTARGFTLVPLLAELERELRVRSTYFVCSHHYPLDIDLLLRLEYHGFEVASHGYNHDNRIAFLSEDERSDRIRDITSRFRPRLPLLGFRSPSLVRSPALFASLDGHFLYDSSVPDVDLEGEGGCATVLPFQRGSMVEIPITLPMESTLLYQGLRPREIFDRWREKAEWVRRVGGVVNAVLHTEPHLGGHAELRRLYREWVASLPRDAWVTTPRQLLRHLRQTRGGGLRINNSKDEETR